MLDEILDKAKDMAGDVVAKVGDVVGGVFGVDSETIEILKAKYDELMADGNISKEEVFTVLEEFATEKGISPEILEKAKSIFGVSTDAAAEVVVPTEPTA